MANAATLDSPDFRLKISALRELSKSGIVALVVISVLGGYLAGHSLEQPLSLSRLLSTLFGIFLLASGSSALNQIQDRKLDATMPRTAKRPIPSGRLTLPEAWLFVGATTIGGLAILFELSPELFALGLTALFSYNVLYTLWWKRHWAFAAIPGAVPGALPILMGYAAAQGDVFTAGGIYLFFILFFWQMPHFWVLALRYREDYEKGGVPTLPVALGKDVTVFQIVLWTLAYIAIAVGAPLFFPVQVIYLPAAIAISGKLLWELRGFYREPDSRHWLRFFLWVNFSLIILIGALVVDLWSIYALIPLTQ